jgi:hypothetical protein
MGGATDSAIKLAIALSSKAFAAALFDAAGASVVCLVSLRDWQQQEQQWHDHGGQGRGREALGGL